MPRRRGRGTTAHADAARIDAITCLAPSGDDPSTAWAGSTDGVLLQTRDAGRSWALA
ncbi:MAG: hypothetical protein KGS47_07050 [Chloroflexi bacterium]|nr:hypothetical protein [Chloroflexota bacterium]